MSVFTLKRYLFSFSNFVPYLLLYSNCCIEPNAKKKKKNNVIQALCCRPSAIRHSRHQPLKSRIGWPLASSIVLIQPLEAQIPRMIAIHWFGFISMLSFHWRGIKVWAANSKVKSPCWHQKVSQMLHLLCIDQLLDKCIRLKMQTLTIVEATSTCAKALCKGIKHKVKYRSAFRRSQL